MAIRIDNYFDIFFATKADYDAAVAANGGSFTYDGTPQAAAAVYGYPFPPSGLQDDYPWDPGISYGSSFRKPGEEILFGHNTGVFVDPTVQDAFVPGKPASGIFPAYPDGFFHWLGLLRWSSGGAQIPLGTPIMQRRWIDGFELIGTASGEGGTGGGLGLAGRASSRTMEGMGLAYRGWTNRTITHTLTEFGGSTNRLSWERFYVRLVKTPSANQNIWCVDSSAESTPSINAYVTSGGAIEFYNQGGDPAPGTLVGTTGGLTIGTWYRLDALITYRDAGNPGHFTLYVNGVLTIDAAIANGVGLGFGFQVHAGSLMGNRFSSADFGLEIDIDDWMSAEQPTVLDSTAGLDWLSGSHIRLTRATAFGTGHSVNWTGDFRTTMQVPPQGTSVTNVLTASVAGATLRVTTDARDPTQESPMNGFGVAAAIVSLYSLTGGGGATATLGYSLAGAAPVTTTITTAAATWNRFMYRPTGMITPATVEPFDLVHTKDTVAAARTVKALVSAVEYLGVFAPEDALPGSATTAPPRLGIHNAPYAQAPWATVPAASIGWVTIIAGTYVGNGTGQDLTLPAPPHLLIIRPLTGTTQGVWWSSTTNTARRGIEQRSFPDLLPRAKPAGVLMDDLSTLVQIAGLVGDSNAVGVTYQYIAVCDPARRFIHNGAFAHDSSIASAVNTLIDPAFTPLCAFFFLDETNGQNTRGVYYKGPGHDALTGSPINLAEETDVASLATGAITSGTDLHDPNQPTGGEPLQTAFSVIRADDGAVCNPGADHPPFAATFYTGDGTASRDIPLGLDGAAPIFALVVPHNATSYVKDPSHGGANSTPAGGGVASTVAITGGAVDQLTVGSLLNALGVDYDVFVIPGDATAFANGTFVPVSPCAGPDGGLPDPPDPGNPTGCTALI